MNTVNAYYDGDHDEDHHLVVSKQSLDEGVPRPLQSECLVDENEIITSKQSNLGKPVFSNIDEFPENLRTAFNPPPGPFSEKKYCDFFYKPDQTAPNLQRNFLDRK